MQCSYFKLAEPKVYGAYIIRKVMRSSIFFSGAAVAQSQEFSGPGSRLAQRKPPRMPMAPNACKICCGCNVLQVPIQIIPLGIPKLGNHLLRGGSKLRWHVSGSSFGLTPRPSAIAYQRCFSPTLNQPNPLIYHSGISFLLNAGSQVIFQKDQIVSCSRI